MMRFLSCVALMALVSCVALMALVSCEDLVYSPEDFKILHERAGHFANVPALEKTYELYTKAFDPKWHDDDYRNFRPTESQCYYFLQRLLDNGLKVERLADFVKYDACLGVIYEDAPYPYEDQAKLEKLRNVQKFKDLYHNTSIEGMTVDTHHCIGNLLSNVIHGYKQYEAPNNHILQLCTQFGECTDKYINKTARADPYLEELFELVGREAKSAFEATVGEIETLAEELYKARFFKNAGEKVMSKFFSSLKARLEKRWSPEVVNLLDVTKADGETLTLRSVHEKVKKFFQSKELYGEELSDDRDKKTQQFFLKKFLELLGQKATKAIVRGKNSPKLYHGGDSAYEAWKDTLCKPFEYSDMEGWNDFNLKTQRLVGITAYADLFKVDKRYFLSTVLKQAGTAASIYLSLNVCHILYSTRGSLTQMTSESVKYNKEKDFVYKVVLSEADTVKWPVLPYI